MQRDSPCPMPSRHTSILPGEKLLWPLNKPKLPHRPRRHHRISPIMAENLTKTDRLADGQMLALLEWATDHPKAWHDIGTLDATRQAAALLDKRGVIEI